MGNSGSSGGGGGADVPPAPPAPTASPATPEGQGQQLLVDAHRCFKKWGASKEQKFSEAAAMYQRAATKFKIAKKYQASGDAWLQVSHCQRVAGEFFDAANALLEAAKIFKMVDGALSMKTYCDCIRLFSESGKFRRAAKLHIEVASIYEKDMNISEAKAHYSAAAQLFMEEDQPASAAAPREKVAQFTALEDDWRGAAKLYEALAMEAMDKTVTSFRAKKFFFAAWIYILATKDIVNAKLKLAEYTETDHKFERSEEAKLCETLLEAYESCSIDDFTGNLRQWNNLHHLPDEQVHALHVVLNDMKKQVGGSEPVGAGGVAGRGVGGSASGGAAQPPVPPSAQVGDDDNDDDDDDDAGLG